jgi:hypothetical protein
VLYYEVPDGLCGPFWTTPRLSQPCLQPCSGSGQLPEYVLGTWSACSQLCGGGTQFRSVSCVNVTSAQVIDISRCVPPVPETCVIVAALRGVVVSDE